jgi:hypothetical protein
MSLQVLSEDEEVDNASEQQSDETGGNDVPPETEVHVRVAEKGAQTDHLLLTNSNELLPPMSQYYFHICILHIMLFVLV